MKAPARPEATRTSRGLRSLAPAVQSVGGKLRTFLASALERARAWQWGALVGRVVLAGLGLVLLGAIGRSALAKNMLQTNPTLTPDAAAPMLAKALDMPVPSASAAAPPVLASIATTEAPSASAAPTRTTGADPPHGRATPEDPVYLNQATAADLHRLPGVGPKRADAIVALRTRLGHFRQIEDLLKVKGIGRSSLRKLRPLVRLDAPPAQSPSTHDGGGDARPS